MVLAAGSSSSSGSPDHVSALSSRATGARIRPVIPDRQLEDWHPIVVSRCLWAAGVGFLVILCPPRDRALLAVGLPDPQDLDLDGVSAFRTHEQRPGWVPSVPRGQRCSPQPGRLPGRAPAAAQRPVPAPRHPSHRQGSRFTRHQPRVHACSPVRSSPRLCPLGWSEQALGLEPRASHPADQEPDNARRGGDRPSSTDLELPAQLTYRRSPIQ